jgi:hypothetical protein
MSSKIKSFSSNGVSSRTSMSCCIFFKLIKLDSVDACHIREHLLKSVKIFYFISFYFILHFILSK